MGTFGGVFIFQILWCNFELKYAVYTYLKVFVIGKVIVKISTLAKSTWESESELSHFK